METLFLYFCLGIFGAMFGSFSSVLIARWKTGEKGILFGRSACPHCKHTLSASELIPIFSFLFQKGKCKNCHTKIPLRYPMLELSMAIIFALMGYVAINIFSVPVFSIAFFFLIFLGFITVVYIFYDIFFTEIPEEIFILFIVGNIILFILGNFYNPESIFFKWNINHTFHTYYFDAFLGALILYSFLYIQIFLSGSIYFFQKKQYKDIFDLTILYFLFPFITIWDFIRYKILKKDKNTDADEIEDIPLWVGPGDLFIAIIIGFSLGLMHGIFAFFFAYILGSIIGIILIILKGKNQSSHIPFGPFLGMGFFLAIIFYEQINNFVNTYFFI